MITYENFYTGGLEYMIRYRKGTWCILRESCNDEFEEIFQGHHEECQAKMQEIIKDNCDYDMNI